jgi:hypothetical protein
VRQPQVSESKPGADAKNAERFLVSREFRRSARKKKERVKTRILETEGCGTQSKPHRDLLTAKAPPSGDFSSKGPAWPRGLSLEERSSPSVNAGLPPTLVCHQSSSPWRGASKRPRAGWRRRCEIRLFTLRMAKDEAPFGRMAFPRAGDFGSKDPTWRHPATAKGEVPFGRMAFPGAA